MQCDAIWHKGALVAAFVLCAAITFAQTPAGRATSVPPAVKKAFEQAYPGSTISSATEQRENNRTLLRVDSLDRGRRRVVVYDAAGSVVEVAEQVDEKDLPRPVADAMHSHPRAVYVTGMRVSRGARVEYQLTLRGTRKTAMVVQPDGTVLSFK